MGNVGENNNGMGTFDGMRAYEGVIFFYLQKQFGCFSNFVS